MKDVVQFEVLELWTYPVKSCRGISHAICELDRKGLVGDRRWMFIDGENTLVSQRTLPEMAQISVVELSDGVEISAPEMSALFIPAGGSSGSPFWAKIHRDGCYVLKVGELPTDWFARFYQRNAKFAAKHPEGTCRLVVQAQNTIRQVDRNYAEEGVEVGFADGYPVHLTSLSSLEDLNRRTSQIVPMRNFRPNIVVRGFPEGRLPTDNLPAYDEDTWDTVQIGDLVLQMPKPCSRCPMPQIDQESGSIGREPKRTLLSYRVIQDGFPGEGSTVFGVNLIHQALGWLKVGDRGQVLSRRPAIPVGPKRQNPRLEGST